MKRKIIVIKIGSSVIFTGRFRLDEFRIAHIRDQIVKLNDQGIGVILVVSGAVAAGIGNSYRHFLKCNNMEKQLMAGVGQVFLISKLHQIFLQKNIQIAQILLNQDFFKNDQKENIRNILNLYVCSGIIPVINENDVVELNNFGGNDLLASEVAKLVGAGQLLILSTMEGSPFGVGGGISKQVALNELGKYHIRSSIINGKEKDAIIRSILYPSYSGLKLDRAKKRIRGVYTE